jgi:hypothetical protein
MDTGTKVHYRCGKAIIHSFRRITCKVRGWTTVQQALWRVAVVSGNILYANNSVVTISIKRMPGTEWTPVEVEKSAIAGTPTTTWTPAAAEALAQQWIQQDTSNSRDSREVNKQLGCQQHDKVAKEVTAVTAGCRNLRNSSLKKCGMLAPLTVPDETFEFTEFIIETVQFVQLTTLISVTCLFYAYFYGSSIMD